MANWRTRLAKKQEKEKAIAESQRERERYLLDPANVMSDDVWNYRQSLEKGLCSCC